MNKSTLVEIVAKNADVKESVAKIIVNAVFDSIQEALANGEEVKIAGFGTFKVKERKARTGRNPRTKEEIIVPASNALSFSPAKALKDAVNK